jgi:hypothetical protein
MNHLFVKSRISKTEAYQQTKSNLSGLSEGSSLGRHFSPESYPDM